MFDFSPKIQIYNQKKQKTSHTDQQDSSEGLQKLSLSDNKSQQKRVTFSDENHQKQPETIRNFFMMDQQNSQQEQKPNFLVGGDIGYDEIEEKDIFPPQDEVNGSMLTKQLSDAALIDKRRRLR